MKDGLDSNVTTRNQAARYGESFTKAVTDGSPKYHDSVAANNPKFSLNQD
jgi:hypothetical protein